jgi:hypothetical protein
VGYSHELEHAPRYPAAADVVVDAMEAGETHFVQTHLTAGCGFDVIEEAANVYMDHLEVAMTRGKL